MPLVIPPLAGLVAGEAGLCPWCDDSAGWSCSVLGCLYTLLMGEHLFTYSLIWSDALKSNKNEKRDTRFMDSALLPLRASILVKSLLSGKFR